MHGCSVHPIKDPIRSVAPVGLRRALCCRDTREGVLVIFGEVFEDVAATITHCQFHSDNQETLTVAATVESLPHQ